MPRQSPETPAAVLTMLAALGQRVAPGQRGTERWLAAEAALRRRRRGLVAAVARGAARALVEGPPDAPGVPGGHPLHDPERWATFPNDALLTQAKLAQYERLLRYWAKRGRYNGGTVLVYADAGAS